MDGDRIDELEKKVQDQANQIEELKCQLSQVFEAIRLDGKKPSNRKSSSFKPKASFQPLPSKFDPNPSKQKNDLMGPPPSPRLRRSTQDLSGTPKLRRSASNTSINKVGGSRRLSMVGPNKAAATTYNENDGSVKMHLKGRPVMLYRPTDLELYDVNAPSHLPEQSLELEWVYGYRGKDCRSNIHIVSTGEIVYFTAAVVVLFDPLNQTQRHYKGHNDDVKSIAIHPDKTIVATGQVAGIELDGKPRVPQVHIWKIETLETLHILTGFNRSVACLGFSHLDGGSNLAVIDESNEHVLSVWNWAKEKKLSEQNSSMDQVFAVEFNPHIADNIVSCGKSHVSFWNFSDGKLTKKQGLFEKSDRGKFILCISFMQNGAILTGDSDGNIQVWSESGSRKIDKVLQKVHAGAVFGIRAHEGGFVSTGKDGYVKKYAANLRPITEKEITEETCRALALGDDGKVYVGTKRNNILLGSIEDVDAFERIVDGHYEELWGLAAHPKTNRFLTGAYDKQLILRNSETHQVEWIKIFEHSIQSVDFYPDGSVVGVAMKSGKWLIVDAETQEIVYERTDGNEQHDVIKFSPDGNYLAIGSHDNYIYVYKVIVSDEGEMKVTRVGKCAGHSSYITHLDWCSESKNIQSNSGDYEVLAWDGKTCKQVTASSSLRDVKWHTQSCTLGFNVIGIWPQGADGTDVNSAARSHSNQLLVTGDDFGKVHLYNYPVIQPKSVNHTYNGHSSHVTAVQFLSGDSKVISTGGQDCSVMQWKFI